MDGLNKLDNPFIMRLGMTGLALLPALLNACDSTSEIPNSPSPELARCRTELNSDLGNLFTCGDLHHKASELAGVRTQIDWSEYIDAADASHDLKTCSYARTRTKQMIFHCLTLVEQHLDVIDTKMNQ